MNTYLVPTTAAYCYESYDNIYLVHANSHEEAYEKAYEKLHGEYIPQKLPQYECHPFELFKPEDTDVFPFHKSRKYDILQSAYKLTGGIRHMGHFQVNWNDYTDTLKNKADENEIWSNTTYPNDGILANYLTHTYKKLNKDKQIIRKQEYGLFNTGLYTKYYDEIFAYSDKDYKISFLTKYELDTNYGIEERPPRADYFANPELLVFDYHFPIDVQFEHILEDPNNIKRLPKSFLEQENKICILTGALELMRKKVSANYKLAIPQYYENKMQLLLPLCLDVNSKDQKPDLALAVTKLDTCYQGHTCLTLDMAYNNARLIAKPEADWLCADHITDKTK